MTKTIENLFVWMSAGSDVLIILLYLVNFKKISAEKGLWAILIYCAASVITNTIGDYVLPSNYKYIFYTFFTLLEYLIFSSFLYLSIASKPFKRAMLLFSVLFFLFVVGYLNFAKHGKIDSVCIGIETILIILYSFWFLYEQMNNTNNLFIYNKYEFWIITGFLIYLAGSFFIYIFANAMNDNFLIKYWFLTNVFYIIKNLFFGIAIYNLIRKKQESSRSSKSLHPYLR
jgi:hypothetical protein